MLSSEGTILSSDSIMLSTEDSHLKLKQKICWEDALQATNHSPTVTVRCNWLKTNKQINKQTSLHLM